MKLIGKRYIEKENGEKSSTLYVTDAFPEYYAQNENGRFCEGIYSETVYVGSFDCSKIPVGSEIEILYDRAIQTKNGGIFQPILDIRVINATK